MIHQSCLPGAWDRQGAHGFQGPYLLVLGFTLPRTVLLFFLVPDRSPLTF